MGCSVMIKGLRNFAKLVGSVRFIYIYIYVVFITTE